MSPKTYTHEHDNDTVYLLAENAKLKRKLDSSQAEVRRLKRILYISLDPSKPVAVDDNGV
jgi:hypothetical protein